MSKFISFTRWTQRIAYRVKFAVVAVGALAIGAIAMRGWLSRGEPDLKPWHIFAPAELSAAELDAADWSAYLAAENTIFEAVAETMQREVAPEDRVQFNRYNPTGAVNAATFAIDWNRSFVLEPVSHVASDIEGNTNDSIKGVAVLVHGLTDSPYSVRHIAQLYRDQGFVAIGVRMPGHGTTPGALTKAEWPQWLAAVRLAMREAEKRAANAVPIHMVGYSNGGALVVKYALDALEHRELVRPAQLVLISPMIGVAEGARFAGLAGLPAILPAFAKAAWLTNLPEFNPFKYNSFPLKAARQSYLLTDALRTQMQSQVDRTLLESMPPVLAFQSMVDATVYTNAVAVLFGNLPRNNSQLVLFDINRHVDISRLLQPGALLTPETMLAPPPRAYSVSVVTAIDAQSSEAVVKRMAAGEREESVQMLGMSYPLDVFSLSHIALPFPVGDGLYGLAPDANDRFGIQLGKLGMRGERGVLLSGLDSTSTRISSNPFYSYLADSIAASIDAGTK